MRSRTFQVFVDGEWVDLESMTRPFETQYMRAVEADRTTNETRELLQRALAEHLGYEVGDLWARDHTDAWVVYEIWGAGERSGLFQVDYTVGDDDLVTFGEPVEVEDQTKYVPLTAATASTEATAIDRLGGRVLEAKGEADGGGRVYRVRIIDFGESRNGKLYPQKVMEAAASMYEGAKAFDHHRTPAEMLTSTVAGLVGSYRNVEAVAAGIDADLHLLPSAGHVAEAFDASLVQQAAGLPPLIGVSHDVFAAFKPVHSGGRTVMEATAILAVNSADVVADPAAGGRATRMVAGGSGAPDPVEGTMKLSELLELLRNASAEDRPGLLEEHAQVLTDSGITAEQALTLVADTGGSSTPSGDAETETPVTVGSATEASAPVTTFAKASILGRQILTVAVEAAKLPAGTVDAIATGLPDRFTEAHIAVAIEGFKRMAESMEAAGLAPRGGDVNVTEDHRDKVIARIDATLERRWQEGYTSYVEMFEDFTGTRLRGHPVDVAQRIVRESWDMGRVAGRAVEASVGTDTFAQALGDSITRRLIKIYKAPGWDAWKKIAVTSPVKDFREQKRDRIGGFGDLATVLERGTYQEIDSQTDEEATYSITKKGGTKGITFEAVTNDDIEALVRVPEELGRAARRTLHRFVWVTMFSGNPTCTYDSTALFDAGHANTTAVALGHAGMNQLRGKMRDQSPYGVSSRPLGIVPKLLVVPNELEGKAVEITGDKAAPSTSPGASDVPNLHVGLEYLVIDDFTDADDWYMVASPEDVALMELGFLGGREDPELLMQDDPRVGAVFSADEVTWKIRHIYGGTILDHRAAQRGTQ